MRTFPMVSESKPGWKMKFETDETIDTKIGEWVLEHVEKCEFWTNPDIRIAAGGLITYCFTPTNLGVVTEIQCACGEKGNVTDLENLQDGM